MWAIAGTGALAAAALAIVVTAGVGGGVAFVVSEPRGAELAGGPTSPGNEPSAALDAPVSRGAAVTGDAATSRESRTRDEATERLSAKDLEPVRPADPRPTVATLPPRPEAPTERPTTDGSTWFGAFEGRQAQAAGQRDASEGKLSKELLENVPTGRSYQTATAAVGGISGGTVGDSNGVGRATNATEAAGGVNEGRYTIDGLAMSQPAPVVTQASKSNVEPEKVERRWKKQRELQENTDPAADLGGEGEELQFARPHAHEKDKAGKVGRKEANQPVIAVAVPQNPAPSVSGVQPQITESLSVTRADYPGFVRTAVDPLSTFSIDVDTASYTQIRRTLNEGYLPPTDNVRLEEMINYFPYDYAAPAAGEPFSVAVEGAPSPWGGTDLVRIGVQGKKVTGRDACHLTFLVDVSGSMSGPDRLGLVQESLKMLVSGLGDGDTVALVVYAGSSGVVLEPTAIRNKAEIAAAIDRLQAGGSTAMGQGIEMAYKLADESYARGAVNRVIIASDGDANVGVTDTAALSEMISRYAKKGITLTTLGFGSGNYRDTRMEQLANDGDGNYFYIDSQKEAKRVLVDKLTSTLEVIAKDVKLQVDWNPKAVRKYRLLGYENRNIADRDFRVDAVDAGEIGAGHQVTAIYEVERLPDAKGDLFTLRVRSKAPGPDSPAVERRFSGSSEAMRASFAETSKDFRIAVGAAMFGERLRGSPFAPGFSYDEIEKLVRGAHKGPEDAELAGLVERAKRLTSEGGPGCRDIAYEDDDGQLVRRRIDRDGKRCE
jgi:Ca-activated chloride channel family protein